jgi:hypothetical protein
LRQNNDKEDAKILKEMREKWPECCQDSDFADEENSHGQGNEKQSMKKKQYLFKKSKNFRKFKNVEISQDINKMLCKWVKYLFDECLHIDKVPEENKRKILAVYAKSFYDVKYMIKQRKQIFESFVEN